jgi:hypothetical protein
LVVICLVQTRYLKCLHLFRPRRNKIDDWRNQYSTWMHNGMIYDIYFVLLNLNWLCDVLKINLVQCPQGESITCVCVMWINLQMANPTDLSFLPYSGVNFLNQSLSVQFKYVFQLNPLDGDHFWHLHLLTISKVLFNQWGFQGSGFSKSKAQSTWWRRLLKLSGDVDVKSGLHPVDWAFSLQETFNMLISLTIHIGKNGAKS